MTISVCFDALGTCFTLDSVISALEQVMGDRLGPGAARMVIMDWYLSITSPPPPPIAQILKSTLHRSLSFALATKPSLSDSLIPDLSGVLEKLSSLTPAPGLENAFKQLQKAGADILLITNGSKETTQGYVDQAGLSPYVGAVKSCDEVGKSKPFAEVYGMAHAACDELEGDNPKTGERWFVAAHLWDLNAARKAGFKTAYVLSEQPPMDGGKVQEGWWEMYGGEPDVIGGDLSEVVAQLLERA